MNKRQKPRQNGKLWRKMFAYFVVLGLLPLLLFSLIALRSANDGIMGIANESAGTAMDLITYNIDRQFQKYYHLAYFLTRDNQLKDLAKPGFSKAFNQDVQIQSRYATLLNGYRGSVSDVELVAVSFDDGTYLTSMNRAAGIRDFTHEAWYQATRSDPGRTHMFTFQAGKSPFDFVNSTPTETIMASRAILDEDGNPLGVSLLLMYNNILEQSMTNILDKKGSFVYVLGEDGEVIYSPVVGSIPDVNSDQYVRVDRMIEPFSWQVVGMMRVQGALSRVQLLSQLFYVCVLILAAAMALGAAVLSRRILNPLIVLSADMKRAQRGDLEVRFEPGGNDELNELGMSFNEMLDKIRELLAQVYQEQRAKRKAEMAALQANIKPHFLYNTLDTIGWMANEYHAKDIMETVEALSTLFRVALSKGSDIIPVEQEILHVSSYLQIQKVRYEDQVEYSVTVEPGCEKLMVQKLILQPLVENAIYHGIKESGRSGRIKVRVHNDGKALMLAVSDDGIGITPERLKEVRAALLGADKKEGGAYGVLNVHQRLVLNYGGDYGLSIESEYGQGTICSIRHPLLTR